MTSSLREMNEQRQAWMNSKPQFDGGFDYRPKKDDILVGWFVANGDEGDRFIKVYKAHILAGKTKSGGDLTIHSYCPLSSNDPEVTQCANCEAAASDIKERMSMYFYVEGIYHSALPEGKNFPIAEYQGKRYFAEEVKGFRVWHASAWKESPWGDIVKLAEIYKGLHNTAIELSASGEGINRRYKVIALPQTPSFDHSLYQRAKQELTPLRELLVKEMTTATVAGPAAQQASIVAGAPAFQLGMSGPPVASPIATAPFSVGQPAPAAAPFAMSGASEQNAPSPETPTESAPPEGAAPAPEAPAETEDRRPLKKLF